MRRGYAFSGTWTVEAPLPRVHAVLADLPGYPQWWPQVLAVATLGPDRARVVCRSTLPFTLDLELRAVRREETCLEVRIRGALEGSAAWRLTERGRRTGVDFAQEVTVGGWLAAVSPVARPVFGWNHARMMRGCVAGLAARLAEQHEGPAPSAGG